MRWEPRGRERYVLQVDTGEQLAQVAHVWSPSGDPVGWMVWLSLEQAELFDHFATATAAMRAAEDALDPDRK